jgi:hypothetical protein
MHHRVSPHFAELSSAIERKFFDNIDHRRNGSFRQPDIHDENLASPVLNNVLRSIYCLFEASPGAAFEQGFFA